MPFQRAAEQQPVCGAGLVHALEQARPERAAVNHDTADAGPYSAGAVKHSAPLAAAPGVEAVGVLETQQGFGVAIAGLLAKIAPRVLPPVVPDGGPRSKGNPEAGLLQAPAEVHVVAGPRELRVETIDA